MALTAKLLLLFLTSIRSSLNKKRYHTLNFCHENDDWTMLPETLEKYFPAELLKRTLRNEAEFGWRIEDVPAVIEAARKAALLTTGGSLLVFIPEDVGGGTCESIGARFSTYETSRSFSTESPWREKVEAAAQVALARFNELKSKIDFLKEGKEVAGSILDALGRPNADIENMLGFALWFQESSIVDKIKRPITTGDAGILARAQEALDVRGDYEAARTLAAPLAEQGNPLAQMLMANTYKRVGDGDKSLEEHMKWLKMAAAQGHAQAWYHLHMQYMWGQGVEENLVEAANCLRKAAEQGHVMACSFLGTWYRQGKGVKKDSAEAFKWLQMAASFGRPESQGELGLLYLWGIGRPENYEEAYYWLSLAVQSSWNCMYLPKRYEASRHLTSDQVQAIKKRVKEWKKTPLPPEANAPYFPTE